MRIVGHMEIGLFSEIYADIILFHEDSDSGVWLVHAVKTWEVFVIRNKGRTM